MNADSKHSEFIRALEQSQTGQKLHKEIAAKRLADRQALVKELEAARAAFAEEIPAIDDGVERAICGVREAEIALVDANEQLRIANGAKFSANAEFNLLSNLYVGQLKATASPLVEEFRAWASAELSKLPKALKVERESKATIAGLTHFVETNRDALVARQAALLAVLREQIPALEIEVDDAVVDERIKAFKAALPSVAEPNGAR